MTVPYAQIDVSAPRHRKVSALSDRAFRLWIAGLCYCQEHLTDGVIHRKVVRTLLQRGHVRESLITELVEADLWKTDPDHGWRVHDYLAWNESRDQVLARRAKWRDRRKTAPPAPVEKSAGTGGTHPSVHGDARGTLGYAPLRSTDQDQKQEHPADAGPRTRLRTTDRTDAPKPTLLAAIAHEVLALHPGLGDADLKESVKARAAQLRVAYDAESVRKALDGVQRKGAH